MRPLTQLNANGELLTPLRFVKLSGEAPTQFHSLFCVFGSRGCTINSLNHLK